MLKKLINPLSRSYKEFKQLVNDQEFTWSWSPVSVPLSVKPDKFMDKGYYTHAFLTRPEEGHLLFPKESSKHIKLAYTIVSQILMTNNIKPSIFYRINANCDHPDESGLPNLPHVDHKFPHENLLIYLSNPNEGYTMVEGEKYYGKEDDVILFNGVHCNAAPKIGRRLVTIATFSRCDSQ